MTESQFSALLTVVVPPIVKLIADWAEYGEVAAMKDLYHSTVYAQLSDETSKMWRLSPKTIFEMYKQEKLTGRFDWPEECS